MILFLPRSLWDAIAAAVMADYPAEGCGLLIGQRDQEGHCRVQSIRFARNLLADQPGRFLLDPVCRFQAERECRSSGQHILGHWHSHPDGQAQPSLTDLEQAYEPHLIWLIVSTDGRAILDRGAFGLGGDPLVPWGNVTIQVE